MDKQEDLCSMKILNVCLSFNKGVPVPVILGVNIWDNFVRPIGSNRIRASKYHYNLIRIQITANIIIT